MFIGHFASSELVFTLSTERDQIQSCSDKGRWSFERPVALTCSPTLRSTPERVPTADHQYTSLLKAQWNKSSSISFLGRTTKLT